MTQPSSKPQNTFATVSKNLVSLQECLSEASGRITAKNEDKFDQVTRFPEKNLLVHTCIHRYDAWHKSFQDYVMGVCHKAQVQSTLPSEATSQSKPNPMEQCEKLTKLLNSKNHQVKTSMLELYKKASVGENASYEEKVLRVAAGEKPVTGDPFAQLEAKQVEDRWKKS